MSWAAVDTQINSLAKRFRKGFLKVLWVQQHEWDSISAPRSEEAAGHTATVSKVNGGCSTATEKHKHDRRVFILLRLSAKKKV